MAMRDNGERQGLTESFRSQTGYGTAPLTSATKKTTPKTRKFIAKKVFRTDTLVGIALKYAVSVQELKRENKLWNTDHLFLRPEILIPLTAENEGLLDENDTIVIQDGFSSPHSLSGPEGAGPSGAAGGLHNGSASSSNGNHSSQAPHSSSSSSFSGPPSSSSSSSLASSSKGQRASSLPSEAHPLSSSSKSMSSSSKGKSKRERSNNSNNNSSSSGSTITAAESSVSGGSSSMAEDFFSKYDSSIAQLRGDVEKMEKNAAKLDGLLDSNPLSLPPQALRRQSSGTASGYSRKGSAASLSSVSGGERDRRSRTAALLLDEEAEAGTSAGQPSGSTEDTSTTAAIVHAQSESPVLMIRSRTNNRQVKSALENLRQADDDLFEL